MSIPIIDPTQSVLGYRQWEYFEFQPYAAHTPTGWSSNNALPAGLSLNAATGKISGAAEVPGVWVLGLTASNADGNSAEQKFTIGVEPGALVPDSLPWLAVDVVTGKISVDGVAVEPLTAEVLAKLEAGGDYEPPCALGVKEGDDLLARVSFLRATTVQDINLDALRMVLKQYEPEAVLCVSSETFEKQGTSTGTNFLLHSRFDGSSLAGALSNYESDAGTFFYGIAEIEYTQVNSESVGPAVLVRSSATFLIRIERDLANNV